MTPPVPNYVHYARLARPDEIPKRAQPVHDGDTFYLRVDLGTYTGNMRIDPVIQIRLKGIDTYELGDEVGDIGQAARDFTRQQLSGAGIVTVATEKPIVHTPFGTTLSRTIAQVWVDDDDLADLLRAAGFEKGQ